ncbi:MaoC family dehydratase [Sphingopyxis sp. BE249]|uniref:MaoC family dehydratase n=1 Tax=Sphingopyxis sp. BE249 TaxID=2817719 RepID=UPI0028572E71|nr:MaoC family dehydratase [Sphingopyxis sp. BE249]MDR7058813.1 acyl dehydratase [Sphingopyxis sp. BE235]MDR7179001.1 acyl dehydratase [Sphingopyxis sp. BE249]
MQVGQQWHGGPIEMTEADIIRFASEYDPQPMHIDNAAAASGRFGGIIASGWHVASVVMRDFVEAAPFGSTPLLGLKIDDLTWRVPVRPGDVLRITREVVDIAHSKSKPDRGVLTMRMTVTNQEGAVVMAFTNLIQMPTRPVIDS